MLELKATFRRKDTEISTQDCVVDKVIHLSGSLFDRFSHDLMRDWSFIRDNKIDRVVDENGRYHCLLVTGEGRRDGILVNAEGGDYARYSAFIPNAEDLLTIGRYSALSKLSKTLTDIVDHIVEQVTTSQTKENYTIDMDELNSEFRIYMDISIIDTVLNMLDEREEMKDFTIDKDEFIIQRNSPNLKLSAEDLSDPTVSLTDMYAYGYSYIGMNPLGKERAIELFDKGYGIFRLYENDIEDLATDRADIESFDGMFGISNPEWDIPGQESYFQVFILNREKNADGELRGDWLTLPATSEALQNHLDRIGVDRPSEGAFTVTAIRMPMVDYIRDYISKYDSIDELNMLALRIDGLQDYEVDKFKAILGSGTIIGNDTAALINVLDIDNFDAFNLIDAKNAEELGRYYANENNEVPDGVSYEDYGKKCVREEGGVFTEQGYIYFRYKELSKEYEGVVPNEYKIVENALRRMREKTQGRNPGEKRSVMKEIEASRQAPPKTNDTDKPKRNKKKGEPDL